MNDFTISMFSTNSVGRTAATELNVHADCVSGAIAKAVDMMIEFGHSMIVVRHVD